MRCKRIPLARWPNAQYIGPVPVGVIPPGAAALASGDLPWRFCVRGTFMVPLFFNQWFINDQSLRRKRIPPARWPNAQYIRTNSFAHNTAWGGRNGGGGSGGGGGEGGGGGGSGSDVDEGDDGDDDGDDDDGDDCSAAVARIVVSSAGGGGAHAGRGQLLLQKAALAPVPGNLVTVLVQR